MAAEHGFGTKFDWGTSGTVAQLTSIGGVEMTADTVDVSTLDGADNFKEFAVGMLDGGEVTLEGYYDSTDTTGQAQMYTDFLARTSASCTITFPGTDASTWTFTAFITAYKTGDATVDGAVAFGATLKITGKPTFTV